MKKTYRFGYLFALLAVFGLFACNENGEEEEVVVNDSPFVGVWNLNTSTTAVTYDLLDSLNNVIGKRDLPTETQYYKNAPIHSFEFKTDYTALAQVGDLSEGPFTTMAYLWEDLGDKLVMRTLNTYEKPFNDTMNIVKNGNAVTLTTTRKSNANFSEDVDFYDEELDSTYQIKKSYPAIKYTNITIDIDK